MAASLDHRTQQMDGPPVDEEKIGGRVFCHSAHTHTHTHTHTRVAGRDNSRQERLREQEEAEARKREQQEQHAERLRRIEQEKRQKLLAPWRKQKSRGGWVCG